MNHPNASDPSFFMILKFNLSRQEIEAESTSRAKKWLWRLTSTRQIAWANRTKLVLQVGGYDTDKRELYEIPEVCKFLQLLHKDWPYWYFFAKQDSYTLEVLHACLAKGKQVSPGRIQLDPPLLLKTVNECCAGLEQIFSEWDFPESEMERIHLGAMRCLGL